MNVQKTVVVLGMHRSGTSVVAGVLEALGVSMGPPAEGERWVGRHWSNPTGHFENQAFVELNQRILGGDATGIREAPRWQGLAERADEFRPEIERLVAASERELWGWKDPWTVLTLELFLPVIPNPAFIFVHRPREEILRSLRKRASPRDELIAGLCDLYDQRLGDLERALAGRPILSLQYHDLLDDPRATVGRLVDFLGLRPTREELDRALGMVLSGPALRRESQRMAVTGVVQFPLWVGWILKRDLRTNPGVLGSDVARSIPRELLQVLRAVV